MGTPARKKARGTVKRHRQVPAGDAAAGLSPAGTKIVGAFAEAIALMQTGDPMERHFTVRTYDVEFTPRPYGPDDVRRVRALLGMSQILFARFLGVDANTVRSWEQGTRPPSAIARRFMDEIEGDPEHWRRRMIRGAVEAVEAPARRRKDR